jgi:hypothetical protein
MLLWQMRAPHATGPTKGLDSGLEMDHSIKKCERFVILNVVVGTESNVTKELSMILPRIG